MRAQDEMLQEVNAAYGLITATALMVAAHQAGRLLGVEWDGRMVFPEFQFDDTGEIRTVMADLLRVANENGYDQISLLVFLCSPSTYVEGDAEPVTMIEDPDRLIEMTQRALGIRW